MGKKEGGVACAATIASLAAPSTLTFQGIYHLLLRLFHNCFDCSKSLGIVALAGRHIPPVGRVLPRAGKCGRSFFAELAYCWQKWKVPTIIIRPMFVI